MAYGIPWDEAAPSGATTPADTIDTELQNLKISIRERIEDVICDWADDGVEPKTLCAEILGEALGTQFVWIAHDADIGDDVSVVDTGSPIYLSIAVTTDGNSRATIDFANINGGIYSLVDWSPMSFWTWGSDLGEDDGVRPLYVHAYWEIGEIAYLRIKRQGGDGNWENERITVRIIMIRNTPIVAP
jgi:hypothetical protein